MISVSELSEILESISGTKSDEKEVQMMLAEISSDGKTAAVTFPEFIKAMEAFFMNKELLESFEMFDVNGDGYITFSELKQVMEEKFGEENVTDANIKAMIEKADIDGDGRVNYSGQYRLTCAHLLHQLYIIA